MGPYFQTYLSAGMIVCAAMTLIWLLRIKTKGASAYIMASSFLVMGGIFYALKIDAPQGAILALGVLLIVLLISDLAVRSARKGAGDK